MVLVWEPSRGSHEVVYRVGSEEDLAEHSEGYQHLMGGQKRSQVTKLCFTCSLFSPGELPQAQLDEVFTFSGRVHSSLFYLFLI